MVVSRREGSISSNIRAIIEQLNLNPVERRRLIDRTKQDGARCVVGYHQGVQPAAKISIGVYGCKEKVGYEIPGGGPIRRAVCRLGPDRSRPRQEAGQRKILAPIKKEGAAREDAAVEEEKAEDNGFGSIRSMRKIEDRPRPRPESGRTATIPQANRERSVRAEDTIEDKGTARCSRIEDRQRSKPETRQRIPPLIKDAIPRIEEEEVIEVIEMIIAPSLQRVNEISFLYFFFSSLPPFPRYRSKYRSLSIIVCQSVPPVTLDSVKKEKFE